MFFICPKQSFGQSGEAALGCRQYFSRSPMASIRRKAPMIKM
jgi:hypothetical protein